MTQEIMMVVEQPRPIVMQTTEFVRGGSSDYDALTNKPSINGVTLEGDKSTAELGLPTKTSDLDNDSGFITSVPVTSVNGQTGAVNIAVPSTAADVGAVAANQGSENAGKFLTVANDGSVQPTAVSTWQAGDY